MKKITLCFVFFSVVCCLAACSKKNSLVKPIIEIPKEPAGAPPLTWKEHWFDHTQLLTRVYYDDDLVVYYDPAVDSRINWPFKFVGDVWRYTKKTYGGHGPDSRLFAVFHTDKYSGGHPDYYFSASHDNRNVIDCGPGPWLTQEGNIDMPTHEIFHIVESTSFNTRGSVGFGTAPNGIWGDSKFAEIYQYDVYLGLGLDTEAKRWYDQVINKAEGFPKANSFWFRDWLYPFYNNYGKTKVLVSFFKLLSENFPKDADRKYTRKLNWGEFVHFSSGAAKTDLKAMAQNAFGWSADWESQLLKARQDFPAVTY